MNKEQADRVAEALLEPGRRAQEQARRKRQLKGARIARNRQVSRFALAGAALGALAAYGADIYLFGGIVCGGLAGWIVGWLITRRATT